MKRLGSRLRLLRVKPISTSLGYVDHLFGRPSNFEFIGKDFETFLYFSRRIACLYFDASIGEVVERGWCPSWVAKGEALDDVAAEERRSC